MSCLGVVLAGGKSTRMGTDKSSLMKHDKTMLEYSIALLKQAGMENVVISGGKDNQIQDIVDNQGPLGGIYSIVQQCHANALLIMPIDMPLMTAKLLQQLRIKGELSDKPCYFQRHPLPLYLPINAHVSNFFQQSFSFKNGKRGPSFKQLFVQTGAKAITQLNSVAFANTNTPEEWQAAKSLF